MCAHVQNIKYAVAPHTGAWIETAELARFQADGKSHPTRVRGLKRLMRMYHLGPPLVAPHTGAWIETRTDKRP